MTDTVITNEQDMLLLLGRVDANVQTLLERSSSHDRRLTALERHHWAIKAALGGVLAFVFKDHMPGFLSTYLASP